MRVISYRFQLLIRKDGTSSNSSFSDACYSLGENVNCRAEGKSSFYLTGCFGVRNYFGFSFYPEFCCLKCLIELFCRLDYYKILLFPFMIYFGLSEITASSSSY